MSILILITRDQFERLEKAKLIKHDAMNKNYCIVNKRKKSKRKKYFVEENFKILNFLGISKNNRK